MYTHTKEGVFRIYIKYYKKPNDEPAVKKRFLEMLDNIDDCGYLRKIRIKKVVLGEDYIV